MKDQGFPVIEYSRIKTPMEWGLMHGEQFREGIQELAKIRLELLLDRMSLKNPSIGFAQIEEEAQRQWSMTKNFSNELFEELKGIQEGSGLRVSDIVVINNYTDFRDIDLGDQGCSTLYLRRGEEHFAGQTWDMHSSARNYICVLKIPEHKVRTSLGKEQECSESFVFSLVGCLGMMGFNSKSCMIGVNNLNGKDARSGILWPALVRKCLQQDSLSQMREQLLAAKVTSAHNYLISGPDVSGSMNAEMWEIFPSLKQQQSGTQNLPADGFGVLQVGSDLTLFHTNHCLHQSSQNMESTSAVASTSVDRYELLEKSAATPDSLPSFQRLLMDHENYPKSICSHYQSGAQDPSATCGGAVGNLKSGEMKFWRGCPEYDENYKEISFRF